MAQVQRISRPLSTLAAFAASTVQPVANPQQRGFSDTQRIDYIEVEIDGSLDDAVAGTATVIADHDELNALLDCIATNIRLFSSTYGDMIRTLNLSECSMLASFLAGEFPMIQGLAPIGQAAAHAAGNCPFNIRIRIPFNLPNHQSLRASFAPRVMGFSDGGLNYTTGTGAVTLNGVPHTINAATTITFRIEGPRNAKLLKTTPLLYESVAQPGRDGQEFSSGLWLLLLNATDSVNTAYGAVGGVAGGVRIFNDGQEQLNMIDYSPYGALEDVQRGCGGTTAWGYNYGTNIATVGGTAPSVYAGVPVISTAYTARTADTTVCNQRLVVDTGTNFTAASTWLSVRCIPVNQVPDVTICDTCAGAKGVRKGFPGEGSSTSPSMAAYTPQEVAGK